MKSISPSMIDLNINVSWKKDNVHHLEQYYVEGLNSWRDIFPGSPLERLFHDYRPSDLSLDVRPGEIIGQHDPEKLLQLPWFSTTESIKAQVHQGRFYPQGFLYSIPGFFKENVLPFRCIDVNSKNILVDINHPMAGIPFSLDLEIQNVVAKVEERGGACTDWLEAVLSGPGMQSRFRGKSTNFFIRNAFERKNTAPDLEFYEIDRFVHHIDRTARKNLSDLYRPLLSSCENVLDLMAGWESHIPLDLENLSVHGVGLNRRELKKNSRLDAYTIQDLNTTTCLDFNDHVFDAVICSLSVEYLVHPKSVFKEVARVLKPGGLFAVSFSNRWFPEKTIQIWSDLHDFERLGMVIEYFKVTNQFESISTFSMRGHPRPNDDKYFSENRVADPIYLVLGKVK